MDSVNTVQLDSSVAATDAAVAEPEGDQGELPDHGVPEASELIGQTDPNRAVEPVLLPSGREHLCGGKKFTDYAAASRGIGWKLERHCSFHARVNKRSIAWEDSFAQLARGDDPVQHEDVVTPVHKQDLTFKQ